jgi:hypothetical protein
VTSATTDRLPPYAGGPGTSSFARMRDARVIAFTRETAADALAGRTVWCISALPSGAAAAELVQACLRRPARDGVTTGRRGLEQRTSPPLRRLAGQLDAMLAGALSAASEPGAAQRAAYAEGALDGDELLGPDVRADDVVVLHDALAAVLADAVRARGAHAVWHVHAQTRDPAAAAAWAFLAPFARGVDAFVVTAAAPPWQAATPRGGRALGAREPGSGAGGVERLTAAMPSPGHVAVKEVAPSGERGSGFGWRSVLADVVSEDREEHVGGTLHARPAVAAR